MKKIDPVASHKVDQAVLLGDPTRPGSCQKMPQRFGLANPGKWIKQHGFHQIQHPQGNLAIGFNPVAKVLAEFRLENGLSRRPRLSLHFTALRQD